ncbi:MAG: fatty acid desaturase [Marinomonas sp.]|nr:MAG: fatty acid desaturase [Marinomonas sp.]
MHNLLDHSRPPRETFDIFPAWIQPLITHVSGKPLAGEKPWFEVTPVAQILIDLTKYSAGAALVAILVSLGGAWLFALPIAWILAVNGAISLKLDSHYAAHAAVTGNNRLDTWIGEILTTFVLSGNMKEYAAGHTTQHHGRAGIGAADDPDMSLLFLMGFETGRNVGWYKMRLLLSLISPRYHLLFSWYRIRSNFVTAPMMRCLLAFAMHGSIIALVVWFDLWNVWLLAWFVPILPLMAISIGLQVPAEHHWLAQRGAEETRRDYLRRISHGRFFLIPLPRRDLTLIGTVCAWGYWAGVMVKPMLERSFVCVSVMPAHDHHHRHAREFKWPMEHYLRQQEIDRGVSDYRDIFGNSQALCQLFAIWSELPRDSAPLSPTLFRAFERFATKTRHFFRRRPREL